MIQMDATDPSSLLSAAMQVPCGLRAVYSIPLVQNNGRYSDITGPLLESFGAKLERLVYLSTTGVYGVAFEVDETTPPAPRSPRERLRLAAEDLVSRGPWSSLVIRPAAIYGPGRGVHVAIRDGSFRLLGDGSNFVSRIHVEDLAGITAAALDSTLTGRYPAADLEPCPSAEIARFCAQLLNCPMPPSAGREELSETRRTNRKVDGRAICAALGYSLVYPGYRDGIPSALREEAA